MISKLKISHKFFIMSAIQLLLIIVVGGFSINQFQKIGHEIKEIAHDHLPLTNTLTLVTEHQLQQAITVEKVISHALLDEVKGKGTSQETVALIAMLETNNKKLHDEIIMADQTIKTLQSNLESAEAKQKYDVILEEFIKIESEFFALEHTIIDFLQTIKSSGITNALNTIAEIEHANEQLDKHMISVLNESQQFALDSANIAFADEQHALNVIATVIAISILVGILIPVFIGRSIIGPLKDLLVRLDDLVNGNGDLTLRMDFKRNDEVGKVANKLDQFISKLQNIIIGISESSKRLDSNSAKASVIVKNTLASVDKQETETSLVADAVSEMSDATEEVAKNTVSASNVASEVLELVEQGKSTAEENQRITTQLSKDVQATAHSIDNLAKETDNIGAVLDTIQGIAEQTNLLALNAAIEAARAGESGRGFAVVADEVRSLAQKTQTSTVDIQNLVENLQAGAKDAMDSMNKGIEVTEHCTVIGRKTAERFEEVVGAVNNIADLNQQIATATEEQSSVATQILDRVNNISQISQTTSQDTGKVATANYSIAEEVTNLNERLAQFKV
ncbi:methyl-accepting chemotaxis protein [Marinomonas posidonica]|uniref:Methyl-accepting chemotaxis sensory transducer n=1 Tax=Marinomonas posidonica (strain CECT 7376 / NCIMB 14433 / IVIA-Po-181) TaxID=491952 RepID=F6CYL0_MARPP|nr:methyl-accepting chemotaxis protein [Marinomonas posidonica]AEF54619.1 methyl-accepting chemotaxis sensory transducer [Marinomonas posidonica IVIA-Po-181]